MPHASRVLRSRKDRPIQNAARKRDIEKCGKLGREAGIGVFGCQLKVQKYRACYATEVWITLNSFTEGTDEKRGRERHSCQNDVHYSSDILLAARTDSVMLSKPWHSEIKMVMASVDNVDYHQPA